MIRPPPIPPLFPSTTLSRSPPRREASSPTHYAGPPTPAATPFPGPAGLDRQSYPTTTPRSAAMTRKSRFVFPPARRSEEHTSELQSQSNLVCRLLLEKKNRR